MQDRNRVPNSFRFYPRITSDILSRNKRRVKVKTISGKYWLDPTGTGKAILINCDMASGADPCYHYHILSDANRKSSYTTSHPDPAFCDSSFLEGWYRFVGAAGTKMPTTRVPAYRCGTDWSGWLNGTHPTVEDGKVRR
ncbi:unnamed protein product, partial [Pocillopora meandrina]